MYSMYDGCLSLFQKAWTDRIEPNLNMYPSETTPLLREVIMKESEYAIYDNFYAVEYVYKN